MSSSSLVFGLTYPAMDAIFAPQIMTVNSQVFRNGKDASRLPFLQFTYIMSCNAPLQASK